MKLDLVEVHNGWKWMAIGFPNNKRKCLKKSRYKFTTKHPNKIFNKVLYFFTLKLTHLYFHARSLIQQSSNTQ